MKNKSSQRVLIPLVVVLWGVIGYRIYEYLDGDQEVMVLEASTPLPDLNTLDQTVPELRLNYEDPFLKRKISRPTRRKSAVQVDRKKEEKVLKQEKEVNLPQIKYAGYLSNKSGERIAIVEIDEERHLYRLNQEIAGWRLVLLTQDSIEMKSEDIKSGVVSKIIKGSF